MAHTSNEKPWVSHSLICLSSNSSGMTTSIIVFDHAFVDTRTLLAGSTRCALDKSRKSILTATKACHYACAESKGPYYCHHLSSYPALPSTTHIYTCTHARTHARTRFPMSHPTVDTCDDDTPTAYPSSPLIHHNNYPFIQSVVELNQRKFLQASSAWESVSV